MTNRYELKSSHWRVSVQPDPGLQLMSAQVRLDDRSGERWIDIMPDCRRPDAMLSAACFHMLPYSNRIRDGRFEFDGQSIQLRQIERHAIHGALCTQPWSVLSESANALTAGFDSRHQRYEQGPVNWPWPISAEASYALAGQLLIGELVLTNHGESSMPAGLGWHPYFCRTVDGASAEVQIPAEGVYPDTHGDCLPTGAAVPLPAELNFNLPRVLDPAQPIDHCLAGFGGAAQIRWPNAGLTLVMEASAACRHVVFYNPQADHFALEPVSNANDGFNLHAQGIESGVRILAPGASMAATFSLTVRRDASLT